VSLLLPQPASAIRPTSPSAGRASWRRDVIR
jgi:hypothetical protein